MRLLPGPRHHAQPIHLAIAYPARVILEALAARPRHARRGKLVVLAGMAEEILRERLPDDFEAFREHRPRAFRTPRIRRGVEGHHLVGLARAAEAYLQAASQHLVEQRDVLGHAQGVPEREDDHRGTEADARGAAAQIRRDQERIRQIVPPVRPEMVLGEPERVEAGLLAEQDLLAGVVEKLRVALREPRILEGGVEDESHGRVLPDLVAPKGGTLIGAGSRTLPPEAPGPGRQGNAIAG